MKTVFSPPGLPTSADSEIVKVKKDEMNKNKVICNEKEGTFALRRSSRVKKRTQHFSSDGKTFHSLVNVTGHRIRCHKCLRSFNVDADMKNNIQLAKFLQHLEAHGSLESYKGYKNINYNTVIWNRQNLFMRCILCGYIEILKCDQKKFIYTKCFLDHLISHQPVKSSQLRKTSSQVDPCIPTCNVSKPAFKNVPKPTVNLRKTSSQVSRQTNDVSKRACKSMKYANKHTYATECMHASKQSKHANKHAKPMHASNHSRHANKHDKPMHASKQLKHANKHANTHATKYMHVSKHAPNSFKLKLYQNLFYEILKYFIVLFLFDIASASILAVNCPIRLSQENLLSAKLNYTAAFSHIQYLNTMTKHTQIPTLDERALVMFDKQKILEAGVSKEQLEQGTYSILVQNLCYRQDFTLYEGSSDTEINELHKILLERKLDLMFLMAVQYGNKKFTFWDSGKSAHIITQYLSIFSDAGYWEQKRIRDGGRVFLCFFLNQHGGVSQVVKLDDTINDSFCQIICETSENGRVMANINLAKNIRRFQKSTKVKNAFSHNIKKFNKLIQSTNSTGYMQCREKEIKPFKNKFLSIRFKNETLAMIDANLEITRQEKNDWEKLKSELENTKMFLKNAELLSDLIVKTYQQPVHFWDRLSQGYVSEIMALAFLLCWLAFFIVSLYCWYRLSCQRCLRNLVGVACPDFSGCCCYKPPGNERHNVPAEGSAPIVNHNYIINRSNPQRLNDVLNQPALEMQRYPMLPYDE